VLTLRRKFSILVVTIGLSVLAVELTAAWAILTLVRELAQPMRSMESVLRRLHDTKRDAENLVGALGFSRWTALDADRAPDSEQVRSIVETLKNRLDALDTSESYLMRSGIGSTRTLRRHIESTMASAAASITDPSRAIETVRSIGIVHELIERMEGHVLRDAALQVDHAHNIRRSIFVVTIPCLAALVLSAYLGAVLFKRWVLMPIADLRVAADQIGKGNYGHRISVRGRDELATLSAEVNHMAATIASMTQERVEHERLAAIGEMVQRVAHNLRNPLAGIRSLAEVTHAELPAASELRDIQWRIMQTVDRFEGWLKDLIRSTRPLDIEPSPLDLNAWLPRVIEPLRPLAESCRVTLDVQLPQTPLVVSADARHLEQAVIAIVTNAIQASPPERSVLIRLSEAVDRKASIDVSDHGPGVPPELRDRIFQPYFTSKPDGTGIGLALARHVIHQHRGTVHVENRLSSPTGAHPSNPGALFRILIPANIE
jgi:signal transduction histidine kinase